MHSEIYWKAIYRDGTVFPQFNEDGSENKYPDINRKELEFFELRMSDGDSDRLLFKLHLEPGRKLIVRRRTTGNIILSKAVGVGNGILQAPLKTRNVVWMVGWQWNANGRNVQDIAWVFEDGHVELTGQFKASPFNVPDSFLECEKEEL